MVTITIKLPPPPTPPPPTVVVEMSLDIALALNYIYLNLSGPSYIGTGPQRLCITGPTLDLPAWRDQFREVGKAIHETLHSIGKA